MGWATARASRVPTHALASSGVNTIWLRRLTTVRSYSIGSMSCTPSPLYAPWGRAAELGDIENEGQPQEGPQSKHDVDQSICLQFSIPVSARFR